jgi:hypothetical protein
MKRSASKNLFGILVLGLLIILGVSSNAMAQGRGRRVSHWDKKCEKFVNCHDARDGRWDGRGPRRRTGLTDLIYRRNRRYRDTDIVRGRGRHRDRDFDHNGRWHRRR